MPIFHIKQLDSGTEMYLPWLKSRASMLLATGLKTFNKPWVIGDVTVRAQCFDGQNVQLFLTGGLLLPLYYSGVVDMPCPGRALSIVVAAYALPTVIFNNSAYPDNWHMDLAGVRLDSGAGNFTVYQELPVVAGSAQDYTFSNYMTDAAGMASLVTGYHATYPAGSAYYLVNGTTHTTYNGSSAYVFQSSSVAGTPYTAYDSALASAKTSAQNQTVVLLSDGTQLASFPYTVLDSSGHKENYAPSSLDVVSWVGDGRLDLYTDVNIGTSQNPNWITRFSQQVVFSTPQDVCFNEQLNGVNGVPFFLPLAQPLANTLHYAFKTQSVLTILLKTEYPQPGTNFANFLCTYKGYNLWAESGFVGWWWGADYVLITIDQVLGGLSRAQTYIDGFIADEARERARRKTCSDNLKMQLLGWEVDGAPLYKNATWLKAQSDYVTAYISGTSTATPYTALIQTTTVSGVVTYYVTTPAGDTQLSGVVTKGKPELSNEVRYPVKTLHKRSLNTYMPGSFSVSTVDATLADDGLGNVTLQKTVTMTYTPPPVNGVVQQLVTQVQVGTKQTTITKYSSNGVPDTGTGTQETYTNWMDVDSTGQSTTATTVNTAKLFKDHTSKKYPLMQKMSGTITTSMPFYDSSGYPVTPTPPPSSVLTTHPFFTQFRKDYKPVYSVGAGNSAFLDSKLVDGELIDVIPVSVYHSALGDLGMFPYDDDLADLTALTLKVDMKTTFKYHYVDGSFTFVSSKQMDTPKTDIPYKPYTNCVFLSRVGASKGWPDVIGAQKNPATGTYRDQISRLAAKNPSPALTSAEQVYAAIKKNKV
jgi:hypothetical protein